VRFLVLSLVLPLFLFVACNNATGRKTTSVSDENAISVVNKSGHTINGLHFAQELSIDSIDEGDPAVIEWESEFHKNQLSNDILQNGNTFVLPLKYPVTERKRFLIRVEFDNGNSYGESSPNPDNRIIIINKDNAK
jgi:hypothetical protein